MLKRCSIQMYITVSFFGSIPLNSLWSCNSFIVDVIFKTTFSKWYDLIEFDPIKNSCIAFYQTGFFKMIWFDPTWSNVNPFIAFYQNCFFKMIWFDPMWIHLCIAFYQNTTFIATDLNSVFFSFPPINSFAPDHGHWLKFLNQLCQNCKNPSKNELLSFYLGDNLIAPGASLAWVLWVL